MKRILLVSGHTSGHNKSNITGVNEGDLNIELVSLIEPRLSKYVNVEVYPYERDMYHDNQNGCLKRNYKDYDYILEVHFNAFNGQAQGTGAHIHTNYTGGISVEQGIVDNIAKLGFKKRGTNGICRDEKFMNMRLCLEQGVDYCMLETCFYDSIEDMELYRANKEAVADAIVKGIVDGFGLAKASDDVLAKISGCNALNLRQNPSTSAAVLAVMPKDGKVKVIGVKPSEVGYWWFNVEYNGIKGYCDPNYLQAIIK